ncbi:helix-turn-helix transcriptional regulator [Sulfitobacter sp. BSw21498]|uniref:helix-turn-helix transcriptional regulator n=1 Tax=Sulfitobacter sp. BSw21498 TaxID=664426 RepID=UPI001110348E|nr:hypothetical protein [Sulfitobacter sp. BSw21498]
MIKTSTPKLDPGTATIEQIEGYFGIKGDKRREVFAAWGFPSNASTAWSEIWAAMGLNQTQARKLWADLQTPLLDNKEVSRITGISVGTINDWCNKEKYPTFFPPPIRLGARKKLWISLEILAFKQPSLYSARAKEIRRQAFLPAYVKTSFRTSNIDLNPLPSTPVIEENPSHLDRSANLTVAERQTRDTMFHTTEELISEITRQVEFSASSEVPTMNKVIEVLEAEIEAGHPTSSRRRAQCALRSLLRARKLAPETVELNIDNFDRLFPRAGWNRVNMPTMTQATYLDYRKRARGGVENALGISKHKRELRERVDNWLKAAKWLKSLPRYRKRQVDLSCVESTLTMCARESGYQPVDMTQSTFRALYARASSTQKKSLRNAARLIARLQADVETADGIRTFFPHPIAAIQTTSPRQHELPSQFQIEIDMMTQVSSRTKYSKIRKEWRHLAKKTTDSHKKAMRGIIHALMKVGRLHSSANTIRIALSDQDAVFEALQYVLSRGEIKASTAASMAGYLPPILERNGISLPELRDEIKAIPEFKISIKNSQMGLETQNLCRSLIERLDMRADFLLSHAPLRREAEAIMRLAKNDRRGLTRTERTRVRQLGTAALFCAIECGGAPIRVENFVETTVNVPDAWLTVASKNEFRLVVPESETKNKKAIDTLISASAELYHDTVRWFLEKVRPHFFRNDVSGNIHDDKRQEKAAKTAALQCRWLIPGVKNQTKSLCYNTFLSWFQNHMRDLVGITCNPHNFRHGQASLLYHEYPERIDMIAKRLGDTVETVVRFYAWIHNEMLMREGQKALVALLPGGHRT